MSQANTTIVTTPYEIHQENMKQNLTSADLAALMPHMQYMNAEPVVVGLFLQLPDFGLARIDTNGRVTKLP